MEVLATITEIGAIYGAPSVQWKVEMLILLDSDAGQMRLLYSNRILQKKVVPVTKARVYSFKMIEGTNI